MKLNNILNLFLVGIIGCANANNKMSYYGENGTRPSASRLPACGRNVDYNTNYYVALNAYQYDNSKSNGKSSYCDRCIKIVYENKWVVGRIIDRCGGCNSDNGIDVSPAIFEKLENKSKGILYVNWAETSCSSLGQSGSCSGNCSLSGSSSSSQESTIKTKKTTTTTKKTTTKKSTTTSNKVVTTTKSVVKPSVVVKPTTVVKPSVVSTIIKSSTSPKPTTVLNPSNENKPQTNTDTTTENTTINDDDSNNNVNEKIENSNTTNENTNTDSNNNDINTNNQDDKKDSDSPIHKNAPLTQGKVNEENGTSATTYVIPITSGIVVTGAVGVALLYARRSNTNFASMKERFPEAFTSIRRSFTRGGANIRRGLTRSGTALKSTFISGGSSIKRGATSLAGLRTKKQNRQSLNNHYVSEVQLKPIQLHDTPVAFADTSKNSATGITEPARVRTNINDNSGSIQFKNLDDKSDIHIDIVSNSLSKN